MFHAGVSPSFRTSDLYTILLRREKGSRCAHVGSKHAALRPDHGNRRQAKKKRRNSIADDETRCAVMIRGDRVDKLFARADRDNAIINVASTLGKVSIQFYT